jgi:hypothetical protein
MTRRPAAEPDRLYEAPDAPDVLALTRMWGASGKLVFPGPAVVDSVTLQLADIRFPEPVSATISFIAHRAGGPGTVQALTLELLLGLGRTNVTRPATFNLQPTFGVPIVYLIEMQAVVSVQGRVIGSGFSAGAVAAEVDCTLQASPITRIQYEREALKFGMALPGEADGMDDAMREDLEEYAPEEAAIMRERQAQGRHPFEDDEEDEEPDRGRIVVPPQFERAIGRVSARLGRPARVADLPPPLRKRLLRAIGRDS